jgi:hypothetical protein
VGEDTRLAHARDFGNGPDGQAFQANLRSQTQSRINDDGLGLLTFDEHAPAGFGRRQALDVGGGFAVGHGAQKRTIVLFCTKTTRKDQEPVRSRVNQDLTEGFEALRP